MLAEGPGLRGILQASPLDLAGRGALWARGQACLQISTVSKLVLT